MTTQAKDSPMQENRPSEPQIPRRELASTALTKQLEEGIMK